MMNEGRQFKACTKIAEIEKGLNNISITNESSAGIKSGEQVSAIGKSSAAPDDSTPATSLADGHQAPASTPVPRNAHRRSVNFHTALVRVMGNVELGSKIMAHMSYQTLSNFSQCCTDTFFIVSKNLVRFQLQFLFGSH